MMQLALLWQSKMSLHGMNQILFCTATRGMQLQNPPKTRCCSTVPDSDRPQQALRSSVIDHLCMSSNAHHLHHKNLHCLLLSSSDIRCEVTDLATVMASTFLLGVTILGFCAFPLAFLAFSCLSFLCHSLCCRSDANNPSRSDPSSRTRDRQHPSRVCSDPLTLDLTRSSLPWPLLVLQLPSVRIIHSRVQEQMFSQRGIWQVMSHNSQFHCI